MSRNARHLMLGLAGLALVGFALRSYRLTGFVLNMDEAHWLIYAMFPHLLFEQVRNSFPRPDVLFPLLLWLPNQLVGLNELAVRILPVVAGTLSVWPLYRFVAAVTGRSIAGVFAAAMLVVLPLHVYFSAQGIPDVLALFCLLWALADLAEQQRPARFAVWLAVAILLKATVLYWWCCLWLIVAVIGHPPARRRWWASLAVAILPILAVTVAIKLGGGRLSFFEEPVVTQTFGYSLTRLHDQLTLTAAFFGLTPLMAAWGIVVLIRSPAERRQLWWLLPLVMLAITPLFRVSAKELLYLIPCFVLAAATAVRSRVSVATAAVVLAALAVRTIFGPTAYDGGRPTSAMYRDTTVMGRPAGWPSHAAAGWLIENTPETDAILFGIFTFTDAALLETARYRTVIPNAGVNWGRLRDPQARIRYVVFQEDYRAYAPTLAEFADRHFVTPPVTNFFGYTIYDCQPDGQPVAYPHAKGSTE